MSAGSRVLLTGLRGSGKTTYLAALWHLVEAGELPTALVATELQPNRNYLNRIRDSWLTFQPVGRTSVRSEEIVSLVLRDAETDTAIDISLPDLSGELFRLQWATRRASRFYADLVANASGTLLFLHADAVRKSFRIVPPVETAHTEGISPSSQGKSVVEWAPDVAPTQVQVVEMLQFASLLHGGDRPLRVAVVISAWDLVNESIKPSDWLESQFPLLSQYLESNQQETAYRVFGVSAQGGDLEKDMGRLQAEAIPSRRIRVVGEVLEPNSDLTAPLRFVLDPR
jgi:hypothetical protein